MIKAMLQLMRGHQVPSLSVHDSLIVPASKRGLLHPKDNVLYWQVTVTGRVC